jgi:hypothetical protein
MSNPPTRAYDQATTLTRIRHADAVHRVRMAYLIARQEKEPPTRPPDSLERIQLTATALDGKVIYAMDLLQERDGVAQLDVLQEHDGHTTIQIDWWTR